jgi:beta-aspartyl-peptidase (threonine type)
MPAVKTDGRIELPHLFRYNLINGEECMILIVHGGAGDRRPAKKALKALSESLAHGHEILQKSGTALEAVVGAITVLEDTGIFNAGTGGNLQLDGIRRLDASVMEGKELKTGSVIGVEGVRNPVKLARLVMDLPNTLLTNVGARRIAKANNLAPLPRPDKRELEKLERIKKREKEALRMFHRYFSTVGAVALDHNGDLAAGSSTGGIHAMLPGRVGDTPVIGAGVYAENQEGAVSCTGMGEYILRLSLAKEICMNLRSMPPRAASRRSLQRLVRTGGAGGVIVLDRQGRFSILHTTPFMAAGYAENRGIAVREGFY